MTYQQTLDYLYSRLPVFHRQGNKALTKDLSNTYKLLSCLDNPHKKFKSIHVAGTNGKGSTASMLAAILQSSGYQRIGLYTSPHLVDFRERIRINGQPIPEQKVVTFVQTLKQAIEDIQPSFFELTVALCYDYFAEQSVDFAVIEVGMGGLLDSTNVIIPELSVITNIGYDHTEILGDTLPLIAAQKAGILKPNIPAIIGEYHPETAPVFEAVALRCQSDLYLAYRHITAQLIEKSLFNLVFNIFINQQLWLERLKLDLTGLYQAANLRTVLEVVRVLNLRNIAPVTETAIRTGLAHTKTLTGLRGRMELLQTAPLIVADVAHNAEGLIEVFGQMTAATPGQLWVLISFVKEKNVSKIFEILPKTAIYIYSELKLERALPFQALKAQFESVPELNSIGIADIQQAYQYAKTQLNPQDSLIITGSTFLVAEVLAMQ